MTQSKQNNKFYLFTTLSIYVGLVLVGGAPEILAGSKLAQSLQSPSFELNTRSEIASSKLKFRKQAETDKLIPQVFPGASAFELQGRALLTVYVEQSNLALEIRFKNNQALTTNLLPRASL